MFDFPDVSISQTLWGLWSPRSSDFSLRLLCPPVPQVLRSCAEFVEEYGVVDGIYRLSGVSSNIQKLR